MVSISVRPERYSHHLIKESGEFVINLPTESLVRAVDWCGVKSGRDVDKFSAMHLTPSPAAKVGTVLVEESPVNLECKVTQVIPLGSHDLFLAEVVAVDVDERLLDESGKLCLNKANLIVYSTGIIWHWAANWGRLGIVLGKSRGKSKSLVLCSFTDGLHAQHKPTRFLRGGMRVSRPTEHVIRSLHIT